MAPSRQAAQPTQPAELDEVSVRNFVAAHWDLLFRAAFFICADRFIAEDLAQEAMLKALRAYPSVDQSRPIEPWLATIAANTARDWLRGRNRHPEDRLSEEAVNGVEAGEDVAETLSRNSVSDELAAGLLKLDLPVRAVIVMRHLLDRSDAEIAELLDIRPATVRTRLHRGLGELRRNLEQKEQPHA